jgi:ankyrin repeat protein
MPLRSSAVDRTHIIGMNCRQRGLTALMWASHNGRTAAVQALIQARAKLEVKSIFVRRCALDVNEDKRVRSYGAPCVNN